MNKHLINPGSKVKINKIDANDTSGFRGDKKDAKERLTQLNEQIAQLQEVMYAEHKQKLLVVIQAMDTGGKDGTIRSVFSGVNPQGVNVVSFKVPTAHELDHDFLWRIHAQVPEKGKITVFNRSHYEDVLVVRVHKLVPREVWQRRYEQINHFEQLLAETGTTILKFYLHIDLDEQKQRLQERIDDPTKNWKFNVGDLAERKRWTDYMDAYSDAISKTSTSYAPWHVIPANKNWYRNWAVASVIADTLKSLKMKYPTQKDDLSKVVIV